MSLIIHLSSQAEERLRAAAQERGMEPNELIEALIAELPVGIIGPSTSQPNKQYRTAEEKIRALDALAEKHRGRAYPAAGCV